MDWFHWEEGLLRKLRGSYSLRTALPQLVPRSQVLLCYYTRGLPEWPFVPVALNREQFGKQVLRQDLTSIFSVRRNRLPFDECILAPKPRGGIGSSQSVCLSYSEAIIKL
jgi:hypothetical protein